MEFFAPIVILVASFFIVRWAKNNEQFDEDIKYVVFDKNDKDKMEPAEFEKAMRVNKEQEEKRTKFLASRK